MQRYVTKLQGLENKGRWTWKGYIGARCYHVSNIYIGENKPKTLELCALSLLNLET